MFCSGPQDTDYTEWWKHLVEKLLRIHSLHIPMVMHWTHTQGVLQQQLVHHQS